MLLNIIEYHMKSGFVEMVVKRALAGRPIDKVDKYEYVKARPIELFKKFIKTSLPKMEQAIEIELLKKNLNKIKSEPIRKQLINAYLRRLYRLRSYEIEQMKSYKDLRAIQPQQIIALKDPTIFKQINEHNQYDVGSYIMFQQSEMNKVFKHGCFGMYSENQYIHTLKFGVQIREESVSIGQLIKYINSNKDEKVDWGMFREMSESEKIDYVNDEDNYPRLFSQLSNMLYQKVQKYRNHPDYQRAWGSSVIADTIINSVLQHPETLHDAVEITLDIADEVMNIDPMPSPNDFAYRIRKMPKYEDIITQKQLPENVRFFCRTPSMKSFYLGGEGGTGRSMILAYLSMMAHKNGWIVINVPNAYLWTHDTKAKYPRAYNGLYMINQHAVKWLDQFLQANREILSSKQINPSIYGEHDITGVHINDAHPAPDFYYEDRKTNFYKISEEVDGRLPEKQQQKRQQAKKRLTDVLKSPKYISDIAEAGMKNPEYATCAMGQILNQVYALDHPILECVDSFSHLYRASYYRSFRYFNDRDLYGKIPPYHIAHCRLFVNLDGHKIKNGFKVVAASNYPYYKHKFDIKYLMFPENYEHKVRNLNKQEFKNAGQFNIMHKWWPADEIQRYNINYAYTITQGNWGDFQELMRNGHYY